jgi:DNA-directed RNA polymerase subunit omega
MAWAEIIPFEDISRAGEKSGRGFGPTHMRADLVEKASKIVTHPPLLINMVSQRVRQLNQGRPPLIDLTSRRKLGQADIALLEIIENRVTLASDGTLAEKEPRRRK